MIRRLWRAWALSAVVATLGLFGCKNTSFSSPPPAIPQGAVASGANCYLNADQMSCMNVGCRWDPSYNRCEDPSGMSNMPGGTGTSCEAVYDQSSCMQMSQCRWDMASAHCLTDSCAASYSQMACANMAGCTWNGMSCRYNSGVGSAQCAQIYNQATCVQTFGCNWLGSQCMQSVTATMGSSACSVLTQMQCQSTPGCAWNGMQCLQGATTSSCFGLPQLSCMNTPGCGWNAAQLSCTFAGTGASASSNMIGILGGLGALNGLLHGGISGAVTGAMNGIQSGAGLQTQTNLLDPATANAQTCDALTTPEQCNADPQCTWSSISNTGCITR